MIRMCHYYKHRKICTYAKNCGEQLPSNKSICTSNLYYSMGLEKECEKLEARVKYLEEKLKWYDHYKDSALELKEKCNHLVDVNKMVEEKLKIAEESLKSIKKFVTLVKETDEELIFKYSEEAKIARQALQKIK